MRSYETVLSGEIQGGTTAAQLPSITCGLVKFKALNDNAGNVYIGGANVTVAGTETNTTAGFQLDAGEETGWIPVSNLNQFWMITDNNADDLVYLALL